MNTPGEITIGELLARFSQQAADAHRVTLLGYNGSGFVPLILNADGTIAATVAKNEALTVTSASVIVGAGSSVTVLAANANRVYARIYQNSTGLVHVKEGATASTADTPLNGRGAGYEIGPDNFWDGPVSVFNTTASNVSISVVEGTNP